MAAQRVAMRNIKECLRLKFEGGLSHEKIARALQLSKGVVSKYVTAAAETGMEWPALAVLDEVALSRSNDDEPGDDRADSDCDAIRQAVAGVGAGSPDWLPQRSPIEEPDDHQQQAAKRHRQQESGGL